MELRHLRYFVAVAEELSFTRAALRLYIAQPPLSTQIRLLEEEIGAQLFERDKRKVFLTQAGQHFLVRARAILSAVEYAKGEVRSVALGEVGSLALGFTASSILSRKLQGAIRQFQAELPLVSLGLHEMTSLEQVERLHDRQLDVGILRKPDIAIPSGVLVEEWYASPLSAAIPEGHPLSHQPLRIRDLDGQPLITYPKNSGIGLYWKVQELCAKAGVRPMVVQEARDTSTIVGLVAAGVGIAIVPSDTECVRVEGLVYQRLQEKEAVSSLYLAYREAEDNPYVQQLLQRLRHRREGEAPPRSTGKKRRADVMPTGAEKA